MIFQKWQTNFGPQEHIPYDIFFASQKFSFCRVIFYLQTIA